MNINYVALFRQTEGAQNCRMKHIALPSELSNQQTVKTPYAREAIPVVRKSFCY